MDQPNEPMALMSWMFLENVSMMESNTHGGGSGIPMDSDAARDSSRRGIRQPSDGRPQCSGVELAREYMLYIK